MTISKGIVGGFEFSVFQRNLKELARKSMKMCFRVLKESNKSRSDSYSRQEQCIDHIPYYLSGLSRALFPTTFLEIAGNPKCAEVAGPDQRAAKQMRHHSKVTVKRS